MFHIIPIVFATVMAFIDTWVLACLKKYTLGLTSWTCIPIGMLIYGLQPFIFLQSLHFESMTVMNILWDLISDVLVTATGLFYFKERISPMKQIALGCAFLAIVLFGYDDWTAE